MSNSLILNVNFQKTQVRFTDEKHAAMRQDGTPISAINNAWWQLYQSSVMELYWILLRKTCHV